MSESIKRGGLNGRLAGHFAMSAAAAMGIAVGSASAEVITWDINQSIPLNIDGFYIKIDTQQLNTTGSGLPGWDINPYGSTSLSWFASGSAPNPISTYVRTQATGGPSNLSLNTVIGPSSTFANGTTAVVTGTTTANGWQLNAINHVGFRFHNNTLNQINYGYAAVQVGASATSRTLLRIAYENGGGPITIPAPSGPYDPCNPLNPGIGIGANAVSLEQDTAGDLPLSGCGGTAFKANYFKFTPSTSGIFTFDNCSSGEATRMAVVDGCTSGASQLACNEDDCGSSSRVSASLVGGVTYYLVVGAESSSATLTSPMSIAVTPPPVPQCVAALDAVYGDNPITSTANPGLNQTVFTTAAQTSTTAIANAQFFKFTPTATGAFTIKACLAGDTKIAIGTGCPGVGGVMSTIAYNDDAPNCISAGTTNFGSWIDATCNGAFTCFPLSQDLVAGQTYYICVGGWDAASAISGNLNISGPEGSPCPADYDGDGVVGGTDLTSLLAAWGTPAGDIDGDNNTSGTDLTSLLAAWGPCAP